MSHAIDKNDLAFVEERYGKVKGWIPGAVDEKTGKINPQVTMTLLENGKYVSVFHVKPVYYETSVGKWRPLSEVTVHHGNHKIEFTSDWWKVHPRYMAWLDKRMKLIGGQLLIPSTISAIPTPYNGVLRSLHESLMPFKIGLTTSTFYPDPDTETTSVDGHVTKEGAGTWSDLRDASSGGSAVSNNTSMQVYVGHWVPSGNYYWDYRAYILFDTSAISDTDSIDSGSCSVKMYASPYNEGLDLTNQSMRLVATTPASNTNLVVGDYSQIGTTAGASDLAVTSGSSGSYSDFSMNGTGLGWVSKTGITKLGIRHTASAENETPITAGGDNYSGWLNLYSADETGTSSDPKLVLVHTAGAPTFIPRISFIT